MNPQLQLQLIMLAFWSFLIYKSYKPFVHSLNSVNWPTIKATIVTSSFDRNGNVCMSKPCEWCQALCKNKRVRRVHYTISESEYGVMDF